jgi:haloalkane dehalogenase
MKAMVRAQRWDHWDNMNMHSVLEALRSEAGEAMVLRDNFFVEPYSSRTVDRSAEGG